MKSIHLYVFFLIILFAACSPVREYTGTNEVQPFALEDVTLLSGPFQNATELNKSILLDYEPDRLLAKFRSEAGLQPKAEHYHGWEDNTIAGHSLGHYLNACVLMYKTSGDERFLDRVNYIVNELEECQIADGDGYIGAFPDGKRILEEEVAKGDIRSQGFDLNGIWVPYYTQHKVMAGLRDAYRLCGNEKALNISKSFADWLETIISPLNEDQIQLMLNCEHGGINEVLVDLYVDTGDEKYLNMSSVFHHKVILDSLANGNDILPGIHGNTQVPKLIGLAKRYDVAREESDYAAAAFFWDRVVNHHSYVTGGHGNHEYFGQPDELRNRLSNGTTETCNVYNMLKLSSLLFEFDPRAEIADYYERALFNQILSSQHPLTGRVIYNLSLEMGGHKVYQDPEWFTCCVGTGMENHSKYGEHIYFYNENELFINQFIASEMNWSDKGIKIVQTTGFPEEQGTSLLVQTQKNEAFTINIRYPYWAENGMEVLLNSKPLKIKSSPGSFISIKRTWKNGDKLEVKFPFSLRIETMPDDSNRIAFMYGPVVMAGDLGPVDDPKAQDSDYVPILMTEDRDPVKMLKPGNETNSFETDGIGQPRDFKLIPFYKMHDKRYSVYWDIFNQEGWQKHQAEYQAEIERMKKLEEMTFDYVQPGEMQAERDHDFQGELVDIVEHQNRKARVANRGGWFSFDMKTMKGVSMSLVAEYWGGYTGSKTFDILVNDHKIATENISGKKDGYFVTAKYDIPDSLTVSESMITVKFMPHTGHRAGPIFGLRTIKR